MFLFYRVIILFLAFSLCSAIPVQAEEDNPLKEIFMMATKAFEERNYERAIFLYEKTLEIYPEFAPSYNYLALAHKEKGTEIDEVLWLLHTAIEIDPNYAEAYNNLAKAYYGISDFDSAEKYTLKALEIEPGLTSARLSLAWIYMLGKSQPEEAIPYFKEVLNSVDMAYALYGLGMAYFMDGDRHLCFDIITQLKQMEEEKLAENLEVMVRNGRFVGAKDGVPMFASREPTQYSYPGRNQPPQGSGSALQVRLRGKLYDPPEAQRSSQQSGGSTLVSTSTEKKYASAPVTSSRSRQLSEPLGGADFGGGGSMTGAERIEMLRRQGLSSSASLTESSLNSSTSSGSAPTYTPPPAPTYQPKGSGY